MKSKSYKIEGLSCQHCVAKVQKALQEFPGVSKVIVSQNQQVVQLDAETLPSIDALNQALSDAGNYSISE